MTAKKNLVLVSDEEATFDNRELRQEQKESVILYLKAILESLLTNILLHSQDVVVSIRQGPRTTIFEVDIHQEDFGRLIGTKGRTINALRAIVNAVGATHGVRAIIHIKDEGRFFGDD